MTSSQTPVKRPSQIGGLQGIVAGESDICNVVGSYNLNYRGYSIYDLTKHCMFEEVLYLLLFKKLPNSS